MFPNTVPPFFPSFVLFAGPPTDDEYEHRLAGIRAHNRWLVDFCARFPERRAGIGQIFLNDVDDAIDDVQLDQGARPARRRAAAERPARRQVGQAAVRPVLRPAVEGVRGRSRCRSTRTAAPARPTTARLPVSGLLLHRRGAVLLAAPVRAAAAVGRVRALPEAEVRDDRDGLRVDPADAHVARRHREERPRQGRDRRAPLHRGADPAALGHRVLPPELLGRREPARPCRRGGAHDDGRRPLHVGQRLPARRGHRPVHARAPAPALPRHRPPTSSSACSRATRRSSTTSTSTSWRRSPPTSARPSPSSREPLTELPAEPNAALLKAVPSIPA